MFAHCSRSWRRAIARAPLVAALGKTTVVVRGPKPTRAVRELGLEPAIVAREPSTWRELLDDLAKQIRLDGKKIAVQEYGVSNRDLIAGPGGSRRACHYCAGLSMDAAD